MTIFFNGFGQAPSSALTFHRNHIKFNGNRYFTRSSTEVQVGTYGQKKAPVTEQNYILPYADLDYRGGRDRNGPHSFQATSGFRFNHNGSIKLPLKGLNLEIDDNAFVRMMREGACTFVNVSMDGLHDLTRQVNADRSVKEKFKWRNDYRIVHDIIRVKSCTVAGLLKHGGGAIGDVNIFDLVGIKGNDQGAAAASVNFKFAKDTVIGYRLLKPVWDKRSKRKRRDIITWEDDNQGLN